MKCKECNGKGFTEMFVGCSKPASMCCGGCVQDVECHVCETSGDLDMYESDDIIGRLISVYEKLEAHTVKHPKIMECIFNEANDLAENLAQFKL